MSYRTAARRAGPGSSQRGGQGAGGAAWPNRARVDTVHPAEQSSITSPSRQLVAPFLSPL